MLSVEVKKLTDLRESFHSISNSNLPPKIKSQFLECILAELRSLLHSAESPPNLANPNSKLEQTNTNSTNVSFLSTSLGDISCFSSSIEDLETRIIQKQRIKIGTQLMLESEEDQHFELQIRLERRKQKLEELDRKIAAISYRLSKEQQGCMKVVEEESGGWSHRLMNIFFA